MDLACQIADAWSAAFSRNAAVTHDHADTEDEMFTVEGVIIARDGKGWFVGVEVQIPSTRWDPPDFDLVQDSLHATFVEALDRAVTLMREDEESRLVALESATDDHAMF